MREENGLLEAARAALMTLGNRDSGQPLLNEKALQTLVIHEGCARLSLETDYPLRTREENIRQIIDQTLCEIKGILKTEIEIKSHIFARQVRPGAKRIHGVKNIILIASGKGGVGKSTTAVNLALALASEGARTGILDADIYGPSIPHMLGIADRQSASEDGQTLEPVLSYDLKVMSIGFLVDADTPVIWRGPMLVQALNQLLFETHWGKLDFLLVDLPPGTGDVQLSLAQKAPVSGALMVTTPQDIALFDVRKGVRMFGKVGIPILGVVENMSIHVCSHCGHVEHLFGSGGGEKMHEELGVECLGWLPLELSIREGMDTGVPVMVSAAESRVAEIYRGIARQMAARLALRPKDVSAGIPPIVVGKAA
ncbi:MAG: iron-sulfur cluster carrier protein ApbC [Zoogloeaceae bacterium]|jgi:ATP-binding protein involved in chromosome partitioning|nr:iron-sulfur cluster carrier protein ApbC [Zoogloeaceae bacterium]